MSIAEIFKNMGVSLRAGLSALSFNTMLRRAQPRVKRMPLQSLTQNRPKQDGVRTGVL